jgi:serine/threonine-protein kinase
MFLLSSGALMDLLQRHALLPPEHLQELPQLVQSRSGDGRALAKILVHRRWLSLYQAHLLVNGKGDDLSLGKYRILDLLGEGGLSRVFKAHHGEYNWTVALKVIRPEVLTSQEGRQQFMLEMEAMARLDHPNIVQFCDVDQAGESYFFAMEYVEGIDLGRMVQHSGRLPVHLAADFIRQVALGLGHAHERNLVHRDIKPANLFLTNPRNPDGTARDEALIKILDWGLASVRPPGQEIDDSQSKYIIGTIDFLAPEQALNPDNANIRSDIYSLGCTLYYLLTEHVPFPDGSITDKLRRHQEEEPAPISSFRDDVPAGLASVLKRMLAKNPQDRFRTPDALALALGPYTRRPLMTADTRLLDVLRLARLRAGDDTPGPSSFTFGPRTTSRTSPSLYPTSDACLPPNEQRLRPPGAVG